jgi:hypothetical protein
VGLWVVPHYAMSGGMLMALADIAQKARLQTVTFKAVGALRAPAAAQWRRAGTDGVARPAVHTADSEERHPAILGFIPFNHASHDLMIRDLQPKFAKPHILDRF